MEALVRRFFGRLLALLAVAAFALAQGAAFAQTQRAYSQPELDRMLAPIALYPDPLLSQIMMAATYPLEVFEAARWSRANPHLRGDDAVRAVEDEDWDPSVKSLVAFPQVLQRMDQNRNWTRSLGDAFLAQEPQVMDTVQGLRQKAQAAGTLASDERVRVVQSGPVVMIEPVNPRVIYVPYYDPWLVYGPWWWPAYPPVYWRPWPGYVVHAYRPGVSAGFWWGPAVGVSFGFFFGNVDWHHRHVRVAHVDSYYYRPALVQRRVDVHHHHHVNVAPGRWQHNPAHRRGEAYRHAEVRQRFAAQHVRPAETRREEQRPETRAPERRIERPVVQRQEQPIAAQRVEPPKRIEPPKRVEARPAETRPQPRQEVRAERHAQRQADRAERREERKDKRGER